MRNEWLDQQLRGLRSVGKSKTGLAKSMGWASARVTEVINGQRRVKAEEVPKIAEYLGVPAQVVLEKLSGGALTSSQRRPGDPSPDADLPRPPINTVLPHAMPADFGGRDLPIYGKAQCGPEGHVTFPQGPIDWYWRPPELAGVRDAFAVYNDGDSMPDAAPPGSLSIVHPHRGPRTGDLCLVLLQREEQAAAVKFYVGRRRGKVVLRQENPRGEIEFPENEVQALYLIIGVMRR